MSQMYAMLKLLCLLLPDGYTVAIEYRLIRSLLLSRQKNDAN